MLVSLPSYLRPKVAYENPLIEQRARGLLVYLSVSLLISIVAAGFISILWLQAAIQADSSLDPTLLPGLISPLFVVAFFWAVRNGYYRAAAYGIVALSLVSLVTFWNASLDTVVIIAFAIPIITSGLLLGWRTTIGVFLITVGLAVGPVVTNNSQIADYVVLVLILFIINALVITFGTNVQITAIRFIGELNKLQYVMETTLTASLEVDENRAVVATINTIRDQLGYTFARVYMVEDKEVIQRIQTGLNLTQINIDTEINFGSRSGIYEAVNRQAVVTILENDDPLIRQHLLSGTKGALAVPVSDSAGHVIAVLDIQSEDVTGFTSTEINTVRMVAAQLGQALERLRQISNMRRDLIEQDELIARQRSRLLQYENAERQTTTDTWRNYLQQLGVDYLGYDMPDISSVPVEAHDMTHEIQAAIQTGDITVIQEGNQQIVSVPISLRGQTLGAMSFRVPQGSQVVGARQQELIRNVVQRLSLALENKRLFEQSQSQAKRESKANEVGNLLLSSTDINTVLQLAAENFNEALGAIQTKIRLKPEAQEIGEGEVNS